MTAPHYHSHVDDPAAVGRRLKEARLAAGLSQRQLSFPGCSAAYISRLEAGDRVPSLQLLRKLAVKLNADEEYLATGIERVEQPPPELVEAEVAHRLGDHELAKERYERVLEATSAPAGAGAGRPARSRGFAARRSPASRRKRGPREASATPPSGPAFSGSTRARSRAQGDRGGRCPLRPRRPRTARVRRRSQRGVARGWQWLLPRGRLVVQPPPHYTPPSRRPDRAQSRQAQQERHSRA